MVTACVDRPDVQSTAIHPHVMTHHAFVPWVRVEPAMIRLKDDARYPELFARLRLPLPTH